MYAHVNTLPCISFIILDLSITIMQKLKFLRDFQQPSQKLLAKIPNSKYKFKINAPKDMKLNNTKNSRFEVFSMNYRSWTLHQKRQLARQITLPDESIDRLIEKITAEQTQSMLLEKKNLPDTVALAFDSCLQFHAGSAEARRTGRTTNSRTSERAIIGMRSAKPFIL